MTIKEVKDKPKLDAKDKRRAIEHALDAAAKEMRRAAERRIREKCPELFSDRFME